MDKLIYALAVLCVIEGLMLALAPNLVKELGQKLHELSAQELRLMGVAALAIGVLMFYLIGP